MTHPTQKEELNIKLKNLLPEDQAEGSYYFYQVFVGHLKSGIFFFFIGVPDNPNLWRVSTVDNISYTHGGIRTTNGSI